MSVDLRKGVAVGQGRDRLVVRPIVLFMTRHDDTVRAGKVNVEVVAGAGDDTIRTGAGLDQIYPDAGANPGFLSSNRIGTGGDDRVSTGARP